MSRRTLRSATTVRLVACLLLALIGADLVGDASCDLPGKLNLEAHALLGPAPAPDGTREGCLDVCIPDCFCCSRSLGAGATIAPPPLPALAVIEQPARERQADGVRPVLDHPPLRLL